MSEISEKERKIIVVFAIENALLKISSGSLDAIKSDLFKNYKCGIPDCYEHPEYLNKVLKDLFGRSYVQIVKSIAEHLDEFSYQEPIARFLQVIN